MARSLRLAAIVLILPVLSGCLTQRARPQPSAAILETRAGARAVAVPACPQTPLAQLSPTSAGFAFGEATLPTLEGQPLAKLPAWLACHRETPVLIRPDADLHGTPAEQDALAQTRAAAVQAWLIAQGVGAERIRILPRGAAEPAGDHLLVLAEGRRW
jgi:outer membrane protein OmpA-like peptidoglycan-associated protein